MVDVYNRKSLLSVNSPSNISTKIDVQHWTPQPLNIYGKRYYGCHFFSAWMKPVNFPICLELCYLFGVVVRPPATTAPHTLGDEQQA